MEDINNEITDKRGGERMTDKIHCIKKMVRLMPSEAKMLHEKSSAMRMNEAEYMRFLISQNPKDYPEIRKLLKDLINEVNHIGVNINQIVFNHNAGLYKESDKEHLLAYMKKLNSAVDQAVSSIGDK